MTVVEPAALGLIDLHGRAMLSEQGNTVTRAIVDRLEVDETHWTLFLRDVDYLDKKTGRWSRRRARDDYGGLLSMTHANREAAEKDTSGESLAEEFLIISCYGVLVIIAPQVVDRPWTWIHWPDLLSTDHLNGGPLGS